MNVMEAEKRLGYSSPFLDKASIVKRKKQSLHMKHAWDKNAIKFKQGIRRAARKRGRMLSQLQTMIKRSKSEE